MLCLIITGEDFITTHHFGGDEGGNPSRPTTLRVGAVVARKAHNLEVGGAIPSPATNAGAATSKFILYSLFEEDDLTPAQMPMVQGFTS